MLTNEQKMLNAKLDSITAQLKFLTYGVQTLLERTAPEKETVHETLIPDFSGDAESLGIHGQRG